MLETFYGTRGEAPRPLWGVIAKMCDARTLRMPLGFFEPAPAEYAAQRLSAVAAELLKKPKDAPYRD